jgi:hypothetical protein
MISYLTLGLLLFRPAYYEGRIYAITSKNTTILVNQYHKVIRVKVCNYHAEIYREYLDKGRIIWLIYDPRQTYFNYARIMDRDGRLEAFLIRRDHRCW